MSKADNKTPSTSTEVTEGFWLNYGKRMFDLTLALVLLLLLSGPIIVIAVAVRIKLGSPVLFSQRRLGQHGKIFTLYKFRSMTDERGTDGELLPDAQRLTGFGSFLRCASIDEIPQIINIIKGDMSVIGPRATLPDYLTHLQEKYPLRLQVPQGLTSLPAINGRNALDWDTKFAMDVEYVKDFSFRQDMMIFFATIPVVLMQRGINMPGFATTQKYDGSENK